MSVRKKLKVKKKLDFENKAHKKSKSKSKPKSKPPQQRGNRELEAKNFQEFQKELKKKYPTSSKVEESRVEKVVDKTHKRKPLRKRGNTAPRGQKE